MVRTKIVYDKIYINLIIKNVIINLIKTQVQQVNSNNCEIMVIKNKSYLHFKAQNIN